MTSVNKVCGVEVSSATADAFWSKVDICADTTKCWNWLGAKKPKGYGNVRINKNYLLAHRVAFELTNGIGANGFNVCHLCDNPSCCNPSHLMLGTTKSNYVDMLIKNRKGFHKNRAIGKRNHNAKLTWEQVCEIRSKYLTRVFKLTELAKSYGVSASAIGYIVKNKVRKAA